MRPTLSASGQCLKNNHCKLDYNEDKGMRIGFESPLTILHWQCEIRKLVGHHDETLRSLSQEVLELD